MQFVHQHRTDIHIRIDDSAGIIVETYAVYGCQHPAVSVTYSFRRPRLPPIGRCIRSGLVHTNQSVISAVTIRESWSSNIEGLPANAVRIFLRRLCIFDTLYVIGRIFDGLFVIGRLGDFERIVLLFQQSALRMSSPMEIAFYFFPGLESYDYVPEFLIFRIFGVSLGNAAEHGQHSCSTK